MVLKSIANFILSQVSNPFLIVGLIIVSTILQQREKITGPLTTILDIPGQLTSGLSSGVEDIKGGTSCLTNCSIFDFSCYSQCFIPSAAAVEEEDCIVWRVSARKLWVDTEGCITINRV